MNLRCAVAILKLCFTLESPGSLVKAVGPRTTPRDSVSVPSDLSQEFQILYLRRHCYNILLLNSKSQMNGCNGLGRIIGWWSNTGLWGWFHNFVSLPKIITEYYS